MSTERKPTPPQIAQADIAALELLPPLCIDFDPGRAMQLMAILQLACRHPGLPADSRQFAEGLACAIQKYISITPNLSDICEAGWHPVYDVPTAGPGPNILPG